jgi:hypothetical protein
MPSPASPGTNQYKCNACGRWFNTEGELREHEEDCRPAKQATPQGATELAREDEKPVNRDELEFQHGTKRN